jgi:hypothetical protein
VTAAEFRAVHGDPECWAAAEFVDYEQAALVEDWVRRHPFRSRLSDAVVALKRLFRRDETPVRSTT